MTCKDGRLQQRVRCSVELEQRLGSRFLFCLIGVIHAAHALHFRVPGKAIVVCCLPLICVFTWKTSGVAFVVQCAYEGQDCLNTFPFKYFRTELQAAAVLFFGALRSYIRQKETETCSLLI